MKQETLNDALLRKFLLGKVDDAEREQIEILFLVEPETKQRVLVAEQELIEEYLENSLTPADREMFLSVYAQTAEQRQRLRITNSIKKSAAAHASVPRNVRAKTEWWNAFCERLRLRPMVFVRAGVTVAIVIVIAVVLLNSRTQQQRLAIEQELVQLNAPASLRETPPQMVSLDLSSISLRGAERRITLKKDTGVQVVELRLSSFQKERFSSYEAEVRRLGDTGSLTIRNLLVEPDDRYAARLRLPIHILRPGQYLIRLSGIPTNGVIEEYQFIVTAS